MAIKTKRFEVAEHLKTEEEIRMFIEESIAEAANDTDPSILAHCLGTAARARSILKTAKEAELNRGGLYHSFIKNGDPRISTFDKVARTLGYRLTLTPAT